MSEPAEEITSVELAVPGIGQLVNLDDAAQCAQALESLRELERMMGEAKRELSRSIAHHASVMGTKTLTLPSGAKVTVSGGKETQWDAEELEAGLREAGMPEERIGQIITETLTRSVNAREANKAAAANPAYADIVQRCQRTVEKSVSVTVKGRV